MFDATCKVINTISEEGANYKQRGDAEGAYQVLTSFEFILILHLMKEIMGITNVLCQALQQRSQDLLNAMHLVSTTKSLIQKLRDDGWEPLLASVIAFCEQHEIDIPDMNARYTKGRGRYRRQDEDLTMEHHFRICIFTVAIDFQLQELKSRFCELTTELVILSSALNPKDAFRLFKIVHICNLVKKYYPQDFTEHEQELLESQLQHYELDVIKHPDFQNMSTISELCRGLKISGKSNVYFLIDRLIRLVLTLPVSTATTERAFSDMKLLKTRLRNRMEDEFLADNMIVYIEKEIAGNFTIEMIMDEFYSMKNRRQEPQGVQVISVSEAEEEPDRHSSVHAPVPVVAHLEDTSDKEEEKMALKAEIKSLRNLMNARNKVSALKEINKSQPLTNLPPPPPQLPTGLELKPIPELKKKRPNEELNKGKVGPTKGNKQQKVVKDQ
nr:uncharacterized protein LOC112007520 [Quercus suber]